MVVVVVLLPHIGDPVGVALVAVVPVVSTMGILARNVASMILLQWFFVFCVAHLDFDRSPILRLSLPWTLCRDQGFKRARHEVFFVCNPSVW